VPLRACAVLCVGLACVCAQAADFNAPVAIAADLGAIDTATFGIDPSGNPVAAMTAGGKLFFARGQDGFATIVEIDALDTGWKTAPALAVDSMGSAYVAFWFETAPNTYEVRWTSNLGGLFKKPAAVAGSATALPGALALGFAQGGLFFGWSTGEGKVYVSTGGGLAQELALGAQASFDFDRSGNVHAVYARSGDVFYCNNVGGSFQGRERALTTGTTVESAPLLAVAEDGFPFVVYRAEENGTVRLYLTGGAFATKRVIANGVPSWRSAALEVSPAGDGYTAVFAESGTLYRETGGRTLAGGRQKLFALAGGEDALEARLDAAGNLHLLTLGTRGLLYRNNAAPPSADFTATPLEGEVPLTVHFESTSTGHVLQCRWDFGDGEYGGAAILDHTFATTGKYTVTLRAVGTAGAADEAVKENVIRVIPKRYHLAIPNLVVYDDQRIVSVPIKATTDTPVLGFTLAGRFDPAKLAPLAGDTFLDLGSTATQYYEAEFVAPSQDPVAGYFIVGVVFDILSPITGKALQPCRNTNVANIVVELKGAPANRETIPFALENDLGVPPKSNAFTVYGSTTAYPELHPGSITVIRRAEENLGRTFLRGDVSNDGKLGINDAVQLLGYLFSKGAAPSCLDAADVDDGGRIDIGDAIGLLSSVFGASLSPAAPYPMPGLDPTADTLPPCL
jgi:PKD repeat protein